MAWVVGERATKFIDSDDEKSGERHRLPDRLGLADSEADESDSCIGICNLHLHLHHQ